MQREAAARTAARDGSGAEAEQQASNGDAANQPQQNPEERSQQEDSAGRDQQQPGASCRRSSRACSLQRMPEKLTQQVARAGNNAEAQAKERRMSQPPVAAADSRTIRVEDCTNANSVINISSSFRAGPEREPW